MPVFEFVDPEDPAARTKAKSHVARKAHREKRLREIEAFQKRAGPVPTSVQRPGHASTSLPDAPQLEQPIGQTLGQGLLLPRYADPQTSSTSSTSSESEASSDDDTALTEYSNQHVAEHPTRLDMYASRVGARPHDSFWTVYSQLNPGDQNLLQWYLITVPELTFDISHMGPLNPMRDWVFPLLGDSSAVLHSSLLIGAVNNPSFSYGDKGLNRILLQKGKTIGLISQSVQKGQSALTDDILYAIAATAVSEDRLGNKAACRMHLDGLKLMIRLRGGIKSLRKNSALCAALMWAEVSVSTYDAPLLRSQDFNETSPGAEMSKLAIREAQYEEGIFCKFLTRLQRVQLSKRRSHASADHQSCGKTDFLFRKGSSLLAMLGDSDLDSDNGVITRVSRMNVNNCQLACLFYINYMLCEFHGFREPTVAFLLRLSLLVRQYSQGKIPRASLFVWIFLRELENDDSSGGGIGEMDRLDWLIRMIRVARRLSVESIQMLHQALIESLKTHEPVDAGMRVSNDLGILTSRIEMGPF